VVDAVVHSPSRAKRPIHVTSPLRRGNVAVMGGTVLRGDWAWLRRRGDRVWIRVQAYELFWRTTHTFGIEEIRSIRIEALGHERRRRSRRGIGRGRSRVVESATTRVTFEYGSGNDASIVVHEPDRLVIATFQDVVGRSLEDGEDVAELPAGPREMARDERDGPAPIHWRAEPDREPGAGREGEQYAMWEGDLLPPELSRDASFELDLGADPHDVRRWLLGELDENPNQRQSASVSCDDWFDVEEADVDPGPTDGVWIRKRRRRTWHGRRHHSTR
jgi:hypothetical protein